MPKIILFGGGLNLISSARSLKESGHYVVGVACNDKVAAKSNYVNDFVNINTYGDDTYITSILKELTLKYQIDVIIPMEDEPATILSHIRKSLESETKVKCAVMDGEVFEVASNKTRLLAFCKENGIGHPRTERLSLGLKEAADYVGFPALIKPDHSEGAKGITLVNSYEELKELAPRVQAEFGDCSLQEYIASKDYYYNLMMYRTSDGRYGNYCIIKILRYYPIKGGSSSLCVSIENEKMFEMGKQVLDKLGWVGFADFDILEKEDGDYKIIEINPRVPASLRGAAISGINFPEMIVSDLLDGELKSYDYQPGKYLRYLGLDMAWFLASPKRWICKPSWFKFIGKNIYYQEGGKKDIPAFWTSMMEGIKKQLNPSFRKSKAGLN